MLVCEGYQTDYAVEIVFIFIVKYSVLLKTLNQH